MSASSHGSKARDKVVVMACDMTDNIERAAAAQPGREKARAYGKVKESQRNVVQAVRQMRAAGGEH